VFGGLFAAGQVGAAAQPDAFNRIPEHWRFDLLSEYKFDKNFSAQLK
jgi:hypothetical protein